MAIAIHVRWAHPLLQPATIIIGVSLRVSFVIICSMRLFCSLKHVLIIFLKEKTSAQNRKKLTPPPLKYPHWFYPPPLSVRTQHKFRKIPRFFAQKVSCPQISEVDKPPPLLSADFGHRTASLMFVCF